MPSTYEELWFPNLYALNNYQGCAGIEINSPRSVHQAPSNNVGNGDTGSGN